MNWINKTIRFSVFSFLKIIVINIIIFLLIIVFIEGSLFALRSVLGKESLGFFVSRSIPKDICKTMQTNPVLSHMHNTKGLCKINGGETDEHFVYYLPNSDSDVIVTLGGSTTSGFYQHYSDGYTYPLMLQDLVKEKNYQVVNGGVGAYTASQELLKLITEVRRLKNVKLILSLNGINENTDTYSLHPFITDVQYSMTEGQYWIDQRSQFQGKLLPNIRNFLAHVIPKNTTKSTKKYYEIDYIYNSFDSASKWLMNVKAMHAVSNSIGAKYLVFLQPTMGLNGPQSRMPSNHESNDAKLLKTLEVSDINIDYINSLNEFYNTAREYCNQLEYCFDISNIAPPSNNGVYSDVRHHNKEGNKLIADAIADVINPLITKLD